MVFNSFGNKLVEIAFPSGVRFQCCCMGESVPDYCMNDSFLSEARAHVSQQQWKRTPLWKSVFPCLLAELPDFP